MQGGKALGAALIAGFAGVQVAFWRSDMDRLHGLFRQKEANVGSIRVRVSGISGQGAPATAKQ